MSSFKLPRWPKTKSINELKARYDAVIVGGGHNGLTAAAYLAKEGKKVAVLERRHVLGGAAVTEEIVSGFRFSRASYLLSLFRPQIIDDLKLKDHGLSYHIRDPSSFTPILNSNKSLAYPLYEKRLEELVRSIEPLMDMPPLQLEGGPVEKLKKLLHIYQKIKPVKLENMRDLYELLTAPISKIMDRWFESDVLKATLATDGVIGFAASPYDLGTGYVLFHHVMGGLDGIPGVWGIVYGGMGSVSGALASAADSLGVELFVETEVNSILTENNCAKGVLVNGSKEVHADLVFSNLTPHVTFGSLLKDHSLDSALKKDISAVNYTSPVFALSELPNFSALPNSGNNIVMPHHQATIHLNCENMDVLDSAFRDYQRGSWSKRPVIELTIPSSVDRSIVDKEGTHVGLIFSQYTPYQLADGRAWDEETKNQYAKNVFSQIDEYAPNFSKSVVGFEVLPPPELEKIFNITGGNIFHGSMSLDQLYFLRPTPQLANYSTTIKNFYLCGSGTHPGGGVTGGPGRLAALTALKKI
ncbi:hypothetical protein FO519_004039 [Halicephalobus sp. NKZ332]|nr:hypothetical protein FO519_004039 [Halicephalobus sp. NKZ332]